MVERYRAKTAEPVKKRRNRMPVTERGRKKRARRELLGMDPTLRRKGQRGRPPGSKSTTGIKIRRMMDAIADDKILPQEFFLLVINKGLTGGSLGVVEKGGKVVPNVVTFDQMLQAAVHAVRYFAAPIRLEHSGPGGAPLQVYHIPADRLSNLDTQELQFLQAILPKLGSTVKMIEHQEAGEGDAEQYAREIGMIPQDEAA